MESEWFKKKILSSKRSIYLPKDIVEKLKLKKHDKVAVKIKTNNKKVIFPSIFSYSTTNSGKAYRIHIPKDFQDYLNKKEIIIKVIKLKKSSKFSTKNTKEVCTHSLIKEFLPEISIFEWINNNLILYDEKNIKRGVAREDYILLSKSINISELARYLGFYFADGNKQSYYKIYASTKELHNFILNSYNKLIKNPKICIELNFNKSPINLKKDEELYKQFNNYWGKNVSSTIKKIRISTRSSKSKFISNNHSKYGNLSIMDMRRMVRKIHTTLINHLIKKYSNNKQIILNFFNGAMEGDGYPSLRPRSRTLNWLEIGTNKSEFKIWEIVCNILNLRYKIIQKNGKGTIIRIREYYKTIKLLNNGLFSNYPKRKNKLKEGIKNRIESKILQSFTISNLYNINSINQNKIEKRNIFFSHHKGGELVKENLIKYNNEGIFLTKKGEKLIKLMLSNNILEGNINGRKFNW